MDGVVEVDELRTPGDCVIDVIEELRVAPVALHGVEPRLDLRVVIAHCRPGPGLLHTPLIEQCCHRLTRHRRPVIGMQDPSAAGEAVEDRGHPCGGDDAVLSVLHGVTDDPAAEQIDHGIEREGLTLVAARQIGDVPAQHLPGPAGTQIRRRASPAISRPPAADTTTGGPIDRAGDAVEGTQTHVPARSVVHRLVVNLLDRILAGGEKLDDQGAFGLAQRCRLSALGMRHRIDHRWSRMAPVVQHRFRQSDQGQGLRLCRSSRDELGEQLVLGVDESVEPFQLGCVQSSSALSGSTP